MTELDWWEAAELPARDGGVRFDFVPAHHWSKRTLTDTCRSLWGGWVLTDPHGQRVYFAGDTGYGHWFAEIGRRYPGIDLALLPIGAYDPRWWLSDVHTDPEEAVRACRGPGRARDGADALGDVRAVRRAGAGAAAARPCGLGRGRALREELWDLPVGASRVLDRAELPG